MAKKPMKKLEDMEDDDTMSAEDDEDEAPKKMAKGGVVKGFSRIARPQRFAGTF